MAYLATLVERGVFDTVEVSFLPVGHTHNEVDGLAGVLAKDCKRRDLSCRTELEEAILEHDCILVLYNFCASLLGSCQL